MKKCHESSKSAWISPPVQSYVEYQRTGGECQCGQHLQCICCSKKSAYRDDRGLCSIIVNSNSRWDPCDFLMQLFPVRKEG